jgi:hypothetical protein
METLCITPVFHPEVNAPAAVEPPVSPIRPTEIATWPPGWSVTVPERVTGDAVSAPTVNAPVEEPVVTTAVGVAAVAPALPEVPDRVTTKVPLMAEEPMFFTVIENALTPVEADAAAPVAEMDVIWMAVLCELPFTRPYTELVTTPPTARTAPTMMKRSRDWEIAERLLLIFIVSEGGGPI